MKKKRDHNDAGKTRPRTRYNPETAPYPTRKDFNLSGAPSGLPTANSRQQRRQRARLTFAEQIECARSVGFNVPRSTAEVPNVEAAARWIELWEKSYAHL